MVEDFLRCYSGCGIRLLDSGWLNSRDSFYTPKNGCVRVDEFKSTVMTVVKNGVVKLLKGTEKYEESCFHEQMTTYLDDVHPLARLERSKRHGSVEWKLVLFPSTKDDICESLIISNHYLEGTIELIYHHNGHQVSIRYNHHDSTKNCIF